MFKKKTISLVFNSLIVTLNKFSLLFSTIFKEFFFYIFSHFLYIFSLNFFLSIPLRFLTLTLLTTYVIK